MIKKLINSLIIIAIILLQSNVAVFAAVIEDEIEAQSFKGQDLAKPVIKTEKIEDAAVQKELNRQNLLKPVFKQEPIVDKAINETLTTQIMSKPALHYKLIDENTEDVRVLVSATNKIIAKKGLNEGQKVNFKVVKNIYKNEKFFIQKDAPVYAYIETIIKSSRRGDPAELTIGRFTTTDINGNKVDLSGEIQKKGANRAVWVYPLMYAGYGFLPFTSPLFLFTFVKGGNAKITPKQQYTLYYE